MSIVSLVFLFTAFLLFESALTVYRLHRDAPLNRTTSLLLTLFTLFNVLFALFVAARDYNSAWFLSKVTVVLSCFVGSVMLHFHLVLSGYDSIFTQRRLLGILYVPALVFAVYAFADTIAVSDVYLTKYGWDNRPRNPLTAWDLGYFIYSAVFIFAGMVTVFVRIRALKEEGLEKRQSTAFLKFSSVGLLAVILTSFFFSLFYDENSPDMMMLVSDLTQAGLMLVWLGGLRYTMWKYKLLVIIPSGKTGDIFSGFRTPVFLVDGRDEVVFANSEARSIAFPGAKRELVTGMSLDSIIDNFSAIRNEYMKLTSGAASHLTATVRFRHGESGKKSGFFQLQMHSIRNELNHYIGSLIILNPSPGYESLQQDYGLTAREMEIVRLLDQGLSAPAIAGLLALSELTVKTHIHNIYQKTGVKNRIGLSHLIRN